VQPKERGYKEEEFMLRKAALLSAVAGAALLASHAKADVNVFGTVDKTVTLTIDETITKTKTVFLDVSIVDAPEKFAESTALYNQRNQNNRACGNCAEKLDTIVGSVLLNVGITSVNQATGNMNNQSTVIAFSWDLPETPPPQDPTPPLPGANSGFAHAQVAGSQYMLTNVVDTINIIFRDAIIDGSVNSNVGITAVNQAAGNINNQANAISVSVSLSNGVALADTALGQFNTGNLSGTSQHDSSAVDGQSERNVSKQVLINNSISGNIGITQVNQSAGNFANQGNSVAIAVTGNF
jgi:hypothetical protein